MNKKKRRFELVSESSNKFWEIAVNSDSVITSHGRIGTAGRENIKELNSNEGAIKESEKLIAKKLKKGYSEVKTGQKSSSKKSSKATVSKNALGKISVKKLQDNYQWGERECSDLYKDLQDKSVTTDDIGHVIQKTFDAFTWCDGGWTPSWIQKIGGNRKEGAPVGFLSNAISLLKNKDPDQWLQLATQAVPYIVGEGENIDHQEDFDLWDTYRAFSKMLAPHWKKWTGTIPDKTLFAIETQMTLVGRSVILSDPFKLIMSIILGKADKDQRLSLLAIVSEYITEGILKWAMSYDALTQEEADGYFNKLARSDLKKEPTAKVLDILRSSQDSDWHHGRAVGDDNTIYWPVVNKKDNDLCHIVQEKKGKVGILGTFKKLPKLMAFCSSGLYFEQGNSIARHHEGQWETVLKTKEKFSEMRSHHNEIYAISDEPALHYTCEGKWHTVALKGNTGLCSLAVDDEGIVWVAGTEGRVLQLKSGKAKKIPAFDKDKRNYRVVNGSDGMYLHSTTGIYKYGAKPKRVIKDKPQPAGVICYDDLLYVALRDKKETRILRKGKVVETLPVSTGWLAQVGSRIIFSGCPAILIRENDGSWRMIDVPPRAKSKPVKLRPCK